MSSVRNVSLVLQLSETSSCFSLLSISRTFTCLTLVPRGCVISCSILSLAVTQSEMLERYLRVPAIYGRKRRNKRVHLSAGRFQVSTLHLSWQNVRSCVRTDIRVDSGLVFHFKCASLIILADAYKDVYRALETVSSPCFQKRENSLLLLEAFKVHYFHFCF